MGNENNNKLIVVAYNLSIHLFSFFTLKERFRQTSFLYLCVRNKPE